MNNFGLVLDPTQGAKKMIKNLCSKDLQAKM
jgi:hypothetical protein